MMSTLFLVNITYLATGILQVHGHFIWSSVISIPFNLLIIITLILADNNYAIEATASVREIFMSLRLT